MYCVKSRPIHLSLLLLKPHPQDQNPVAQLNQIFQERWDENIDEIRTLVKQRNRVNPFSRLSEKRREKVAAIGIQFHFELVFQRQIYQYDVLKY